jgi:hypothetical protein
LVSLRGRVKLIRSLRTSRQVNEWKEASRFSRCRVNYDPCDMALGDVSRLMKIKFLEEHIANGINTISVIYTFRIQNVLNAAAVHTKQIVM